MSEFSESQWARLEFSRDYVDNADNFIVQRAMMFDVLMSYYRHFMLGRGDVNARGILDLGCGDGVITHMLLRLDNDAHATLVDGSVDMLDKARARLKGVSGVKFIHASFEEIIGDDILPRGVDFVASSLAIHHLNMTAKTLLLRKIYDALKPDGHFLNIDVVIAPCQSLEDWYMALWKEWIIQRQASLRLEANYDHIPAKYKSLGENQPDTLDDQLEAMRDIGFYDTDCFYKHGIFTIFGGKK
ncbi:MAG: methyltransferase domain-containing protein [Nitrospirae bacterium]|nr:methyltransferase domain-containing protein [Nitrospirota bacterium]MBF0590560.1 methyltransferase domain-containing protein [Nitrospirota bacterium]